MSVLSEIWPLAAVALATLATTVIFPGVSAYLNSRITGQARTQRLQNALAIEALMRAGITPERLEQLEKEYFDPKNKQRQAADLLKAEVEIEAHGPDFTTQAEMTQYAFNLTSIAEGKMNIAFQELLTVLDKDHRKKFEQAQKAFMQFADKEADASSLKVEGGSMQPMIHTMTLEDLYVERAAALQQHTKEWKNSDHDD